MAINLNALAPHWPVLGAILSGAIAFGTLKADVGDIKIAQAAAQTDHDLVVQMRAEGTARDKRLDEMHDDIKELLRRSAKDRDSGSRPR